MERIFSDFQQIEGSRCYCCGEAADEIRRRISPLPLNAVHLIGTGDFHYQTLFWLERINGPFSLLLLDNHPDDQCGAFGEELLSCGNWVRRAKKLPQARDFAWIQKAHDYRRGMLPAEFPLYISIDLDILSRDFAHTDWDQGDMRLPELVTILHEIVKNHPNGIIGADICGGISPEKGGTDEDEAMNRACIGAVTSIFKAIP